MTWARWLHCYAAHEADFVVNGSERRSEKAIGSMPDPERVAEAERHVREAEERLARQFVLIRKFKIAGRHDEAETTRGRLSALTDTLRAARQHLQIVRETRGIGC
jgi:hypothetical protein